MRTAAPRPEKSEPRAEHRRVATGEPSPVIRTPAPAVGAPVIVAVPPPVVAPPAHAPVVSAMPTVQELRQPVLPPPQAQPHYQQPYPNTGSRTISSRIRAAAYRRYQPPSYQPPPYQPPVIAAQPVTVPDRPRPVEPAQTETPNPPQQGPIGKFVDTLKPANLLARARDFGEKIEQAGNDILPNIRPQ